MKKMNGKKGTTLVEVMIVVAILGVVFAVAPRIIMSATQFYRLNTARVETQRAARDTLSQVNRSLRQALTSSITISQVTGQPPCSLISFTTVDGRLLKFFQQNNELMYLVNTSTNVLAQNLRYIAFTHPRTDDPDIVSVSVTFEKATYQGGTKALQMAIEKVRIMN